MNQPDGARAQPWRPELRRTGMESRWKTTIPIRAGVVTVFALAGVASCAPSKPQVITAAPPTVVCGTVLGNSAAGAVVYDATRRLPIITHLTVGGLLFFRVTRGCDEGTHVRWAPPSAAHRVKAAYARDGQTAVVVLKPSGPRAAFRLTGTRNNTMIASATVKLAA
jgi:hypothetical protein